MCYFKQINSPKAEVLLRIFSAILTVCYPFAVFFGLKYFGPRCLSLLLLLLIALNLFSKKSKIFPNLHRNLIIIVATILVLLTQLVDNAFFIKLYPTFVSLSFLLMFGATLLKPPSMAEIFARMQRQDLPKEAVIYTKKVTIAWCVFFILNASASLYTTLYCSSKVWAAYNGFISYCLIGAMFTTEYIVRIFVMKKHERKLH